MYSLIEAKIHAIGDRLVGCINQCPGTALDPPAGVIPRCLIFERDTRTSDLGCVIVGVNPGHPKVREREYYRNNGQTYESVVAYWHEHISQLRYYSSLRRLVNQLDFDGPILWTELVKCQSAAKNVPPPLQTFRTCIRTYLIAELDQLPRDWPLIAVGRYTFTALAYRIPYRTIIGVPHPTASHGQFAELFSDGKLLPTLRLEIDELWNERRGEAIWLDARHG